MKERYKLVIFFWILLTGEIILADWSEPEHKRRISLQLPSLKQETRAGMVISGSDFWRWTGFPQARTNSFRLYQGERALAYQVEERQPGGLPAKPDGFFDDADLLLFVVVLTSNTEPVYLYYDGPEITRTDTAAEITIVQKEGSLIPLTITANQLTVGIRGGGDSGEKKIENFGRGCFVFLSWKKLTLLDFRSSWGNVLPRCIGSGPEAGKWSEPEILYNGPIRTLVELTCDHYQVKKENQLIFSGRITRLLSVWHQIPVLEVEEFVSYKSNSFSWSWPYSFSLPVGRKLDENDCLIVPLAGSFYVRKISQTRAEIEACPWQVLYATENPEEGWFAWQDTAEKTGLAVFYEKLAPIVKRAAWVSYRPVLHPQIQLRTTPYPSAENNLSFLDRALACRNHYSHQLRFILLSEEEPETVRTLYHLWSGLPGSFLVVSSPERKTEREK